MTQRKTTTKFVVVLIVAVIIGALYARVLRKRAAALEENESAEESARAAVVTPPVTTLTDALVSAQIFWVSPEDPAQLEPVTIQMPLSSDPTQRSRQLIRELIANVPTPAQRTLPADTDLLAFYLLPDGTGVADFSDNIASETPSGNLSEEMTVDSILRTLAANLPTLRRLKILIHGEPAETLSGHVDLTGFFDAPPAVNTAPAASPAESSAPPKPNAPPPAKKTPASRPHR